MSLYYSRMQQFDEVAATLRKDLQVGTHEPFPSLSTWKSCFSSFLPSMHALSGCFLSEFWTKDVVCTRYMQSMTIDEDNSPWMSLDHTFASASKKPVLL